MELLYNEKLENLLNKDIALDAIKNKKFPLKKLESLMKNVLEELGLHAWNFLLDSLLCRLDRDVQLVILGLREKICQHVQDEDSKDQDDEVERMMDFSGSEPLEEKRLRKKFMRALIAKIRLIYKKPENEHGVLLEKLIREFEQHPYAMASNCDVRRLVSGIEDKLFPED